LLLRNEHFISSKIKKFIKEYAPEQFWSEKIDDAKPDYLTEIFCPGEIKLEHSSLEIPDWDKIKREDLDKQLGNIYSARSQLIHEGIRLPTSIVCGHFRGIPIEAINHLFNSPSSGSSIPSLLTFEKLVSYSLVEFVRKYPT
jgi:hypothetical protein